LALIAGTFLPHGAEPSPQQAAAATAQSVDFATGIRPFFEKHCFDCHSGESAEEGLDLSQYESVAAIQQDHERWEKVFDRIRVGAMPPADAEQPTAAEREMVVAWLDHALYFVDCSLAPDPGRVTIRRLNRAEYNHTVRDLVGVDFKPADDFPTDDVGYGFDNIGDVLSVPPLLIEKYLDAAEQIAAKAILTEDPDRIARRIAARSMRREGAVQDGEDDAQSFLSRGRIWDDVEFKAEGTYLIRIEASADQAGDELAKMELKLGKDVTRVFEIREHRTPEVHELRTTAPAGKHRLSVAFLNDYYNDKARRRKDRNLHVRSVEVTGPLGPPRDLPDAHGRLVVATPGESISAADAARTNVKPLLSRAFRRPVAAEEVEKYAGFVTLAVERGETFERGMQIALAAVLVSPQFLFRVETDKRPDDPQARHSLNDYELASRMSYFLWSSMPDDELFELAAQNVLHEDAVLEQQVRRMMADPKSFALIENFGGQWLGLRRLATDDVSPDPELFPDWNDQLRRDMAKETELFFASVVREDRSLFELLGGRYSFVNERLAALYGIGGVTGEEFRRVELTDGRRAGLITQASVLTLTSYPTRTSPVKRGQWVLENILGDKPPDPPPVVPGLEETQQANPDLPLRKQLEIHRSDATCASCHRLMDDIGFGLEKFDAIGRWREKDGPFEIDASGTLPTGESFAGPSELIAILKERREPFTRCLAEKLLTYALGRGLEFYDKCTVDTIVREVGAGDYRFSALLSAIVKSEPFRMRRGDSSGNANQ
jgi:hypothetical protein